MTPVAWLVLTLVSLMFSALFSGTEIAYITSDRVRVELDVKKGGMLSRILGRFYADPDFFISTILVGNNIMLVIYGMGAAFFIEKCWLEHYHLNQAIVLILSTLISTGVILITGEFFPKTIFRINPNISLRVFALPIYLFYLLLWPVSAFTSWLSRALMKLCGFKSDSPRMGMLSVGDLNSYLDRTIDEVNPQKAPVENEVKIFHNALDFSTTHIRDCMQPRNEIVAVNLATTTRDELSRLFTSSGRSKIVVYDEDIDNVKGYIHVSELFTPDICSSMEVWIWSIWWAPQSPDVVSCRGSDERSDGLKGTMAPGRLHRSARSAQLRSDGSRSVGKSSTPLADTLMIFSISVIMRLMMRC